jgi:dihydrofolate reductase
MPDVTCDISVSMDGYAAGPGQTLERPFGTIEHNRLHDWYFENPDEPESSVFGTHAENQAEIDAIVDAGAFIMGRNMFGPDRGEWDLSWRGWWGDEPPYHAPVFVLAHRERADLPMQGGTTFHFVTDGIHAALKRATDAAYGKDIRVGGGASTIRQYLHDGLVDEMHLAVSPVLLGSGEPLLAGFDLPKLGYKRSEYATTPNAMHIVLTKS